MAADFLAWKSDKVYIINGNKRYVTTVRKCQKCFESFKTGKMEEFLECKLDNWKEEIQYSTITLSIIAQCNSGGLISYRFFDRTSGGVWPGGDKVYSLVYVNKKYSHKLSCITGSQICYGAESQKGHVWGVGLDGKKGYKGCSVTCQDGLKDWTLICN